MIERTKGPEIESQRVTLADLQAPVRGELDQVQEELARFFTCDVDLINQISSHMLRAHGKRLRPTLLLLCSKLGDSGGDGRGPEFARRAVLCATIVELVHTATLIHDDSIDRSFTRRGLPTVNSVWNDQTSVIMGDYLYSKAFFLLAENNLLEVLRSLAKATHRMSLGEMFEIEKKLDFSVGEDSYNRLILDKTAVLMASACDIGGFLRFGDGRERELLSDFGTSLGMAFQIMDDLLDIEGDATRLGKSTHSDIQDGKVTLPLIQAMRNAPPEATRRIQDRLREERIDPEAAAEAARFAEEHGGIAYARQRARGYADRAIELLDDFPATPIRARLRDTVEYVLDRRR